MSTIAPSSMRQYLRRSISSLNRNKLHGLLAEIEFRNYLDSLGFGDRVSAGGWIARCDGDGQFARNTVVLFPETIHPDERYPPSRQLSEPEYGLHTICATFHQIGIHSYFCSPIVQTQDDCASIQWQAIQLGLPSQQQYEPFPETLSGFRSRRQRYNFLRYSTDVSPVPESHVPEEFSKEHLRVTFQDRWMSEMSDVDGILWGQQHTYPIEIKEKTPAFDRKIGQYFGLDIGPFVKLAFYAARRGNLHSLFVVREIDDTEQRSLVAWWYITFERLARFASWNPISGGRGMTGGSSKVVPIPKAAFMPLDRAAIEQL